MIQLFVLGESVDQHDVAAQIGANLLVRFALDLARRPMWSVPGDFYVPGSALFKFLMDAFFDVPSDTANNRKFARSMSATP